MRHKILSISLFIFGLHLGCSKVNLISEDEILQNKLFFSRNLQGQNKISNEETQNSQKDLDFVDKIIYQLSESNKHSKFSNVIIRKYGYPDWGNSLILKNKNGLQTLITPVIGSNGIIKIAIVAYQLSENHTKFKIIHRNNNIKNIAKYGNNSGSIFTQDSYIGLFNSFDKRKKNKLVIEQETIKSNTSEYLKNSETVVYSYCWSYSIMYPDGSVTVSNTRCSYQLIIRPDFIYTIPAEVEIPQPGDFGGDNTADYTNKNIIDSLADYPCAKSVLSKLPNINAFTKEIIQEIFGVNEDVNITFSARPSSFFDSPKEDGVSKFNGGMTTFDCNVYLNASMLNTATEDYIFITMIHEALHGYLKYKRHTLDFTDFSALYPMYLPKSTNSYHQIMSYNQSSGYVAKMAAALMAFNSNVSLESAKALAWGGLQFTKEWENLGNDTINIKNINIQGKTPTENISPYGFKKCQ